MSLKGQPLQNPNYTWQALVQGQPQFHGPGTIIMCIGGQGYGVRVVKGLYLQLPGSIISV